MHVVVAGDRRILTAERGFRGRRQDRIKGKFLIFVGFVFYCV